METTGVRPSYLPPDTVLNKSGRKGENMSLWLSSTCLRHSGEARMKKDGGGEERFGDLLSKSTAVQKMGLVIVPVRQSKKFCSVHLL